MSEATLRAAVLAALDGVSDVGITHDYERFAADWSAHLSLFRTTVNGTVQIRGWTITCQSVEVEQLAIKKLVRRTLTYKLRGYLGLDDSAATEKTAATLAESVLNALDDDDTLHATETHAGYASLDVFEPRVFGDVLCHYVEITQRVAENRTAAV